MRRVVAALGFAAIAGHLTAASHPAPPVRLTKAAAAAITREIEQQRADAQDSLRTSPTSYLAAVARTDFGNKSALTVGSAADNDVRLAATGVLEHHLRVTVDGDRFRVQGLDSTTRCPIPPKTNTLPVAVRAGEMDSHYD